ncbi:MULTISPECIES: hypothetical protein [Mesorhizobium]|uniref:hypothetical protein n=1 Tax=Mesorhizobium TaxID=68287 RepID=UPI0007A94C60|nr:MULTISPECIES: hypothetical protein [Mesorhizobium]AMX93650.1 hypothetical protein A4R28_11340 [Mesorhizobium ciceri]MDF3208341.1 hypothetical protein [Mesorhizobium sp. LMG15046]MDF3229087.1 hypothetical protein [Mesorhizobium sp. DSM 30133]RUU22197.1 hypothetical protein EOC84_03550 [Mesorhizobium sp. Primo-B]RUU37893.1 hypothetical protein EOC83_16665 [Mesorhizobium sp. Primo-A]
MQQMGRTTALVMSLPAAGALIIVPTKDIGIVVERTILELRGPDVDSRCKTLAVCQPSDLNLIAVGLPVFFDHTFDDMTPRELRDAAHARARESNRHYWPVSAG